MPFQDVLLFSLPFTSCRTMRSKMIRNDMGFVFFSILLSLLRKLENVSHAYIWINKWTFKGERSWMTFEMWYFFVIYFGTIFSFNAFTSKLRGNVFKWMRDATSTKSRKEQEILCYYACSMGHCKRCYHANFLLHLQFKKKEMEREKWAYPMENDPSLI